MPKRDVGERYASAGGRRRRVRLAGLPVQGVGVRAACVDPFDDRRVLFVLDGDYVAWDPSWCAGWTVGGVSVDVGQPVALRSSSVLVARLGAGSLSGSVGFAPFNGAVDVFGRRWFPSGSSFFFASLFGLEP